MSYADAARVSSNWRSRRDLGFELRSQGIVGMCDVDTRALTRHIRERGAMRVGVSSVETNAAALLERVQAQPSMIGAHLADEVSTSEPYVVRPDGEPRFRVVAVDLGIKSMTPVRMAERGIEVHVVPSTITFADIEALQPDAVFFSNGPGDPAAADQQVELLKSVLSAGIPYFGICFGNQLFGRALGFGTFKLGYGHRGINQPVMDLTTRKVEVTAHNHGFAVAAAPGERHHTAYGIAAGQPHLPQRQRGRGSGAQRSGGSTQGILCAIPPGSRCRPARRQLSLRPICRFDGPSTSSARASSGRSVAERES